MPKPKSTEFMIKFVQDYLDGASSRLDWDLDFNHYLILHYPKMERENPDVADCFAFYLSENGFDCAESLSDEEHRLFIRKQFDLFHDTLKSGLL